MPTTTNETMQCSSTNNDTPNVNQWLPVVVIYLILAVFTPLMLRVFFTVLIKLRERDPTWRVISIQLRKSLRSVLGFTLVTLFVWLAVLSLPWPTCRENINDEVFYVFIGLLVFVNFFFRAILSASLLMLVSRVFDVAARVILEMHALLPNPTIRLSLAQGISATRVVVIVLVAFALLGWTLVTLDDSFAWFFRLPFTPNVISIMFGLLLLVPAARHFIGGLVILIDKPFDVGDVIEIAGRVGRVTNIGLFTFSLQESHMLSAATTNPYVNSMVDAPVHYMPAGCVVIEPIVNLSRQISRPMELLLPVENPTPVLSFEEKRVMVQHVERATLTILSNKLTSNSKVDKSSIFVTFLDAGRELTRPCVLVQIRTKEKNEIDYKALKMKLLLALRRTTHLTSPQAAAAPPSPPSPQPS